MTEVRFPAEALPNLCYSSRPDGARWRPTCHPVGQRSWIWDDSVTVTAGLRLERPGKRSPVPSRDKDVSMPHNAQTAFES